MVEDRRQPKIGACNFWGFVIFILIRLYILYTCLHISICLCSCSSIFVSLYDTVCGVKAFVVQGLNEQSSFQLPHDPL